MMIVLVAFVAKSIVPVGFMPVFNKDGFTQIVICSGMGEKTITIPDEGTSPSKEQNHKTQDICSYGAATSAKVLLSDHFIVAYMPIILMVQTIYNHDTVLKLSTLFSFAARAPPHA